jgi:GDP-L-fucose synthase
MTGIAMQNSFGLAGRRVWVAGHRGMVGAAIVRRLEREGCAILTATRAELDLQRQQPVEEWLAASKPEVVFLAAATVGGILANDTRPAEFLRDNLAIELNVIEACRRVGVAKLVFLGSSCIYPKFAPQPISEDALLTGPLEPTNEWYAIAKIAGLKLCQAFRRQYGADYVSVMPSNVYGPGDNFDLATSHVAAALLRKAHDAKIAGQPAMTLWGSGTPRREFLYVDDLADAVVHVAKNYSGEMPLNIGVGADVSIAELAYTIAGVVGFTGEFQFDRTKPDGTPRKLLDVARLKALGWTATTPLATGLAETYRWFLAHPPAPS